MLPFRIERDESAAFGSNLYTVLENASRITLRPSTRCPAGVQVQGTFAVIKQGILTIPKCLEDY